MCPRCGAEHEALTTSGATPSATSGGVHYLPVSDPCLQAVNRRMDTLEKALVEMTRTAAIAGQPVSSVVGG